jgi:hypothetical protein
MLLQDALTRAEPQAGEVLVFFFPLLFSLFGRAHGRTGVGDVDDDEAGFVLCGNGQNSSCALIRRMQGTVEDLHANLEQLVRVSQDEWQIGLQLGLHLDFESLPLRLRELDSSPQYGVEIHGSHCGGSLFGETEQTGHQ